MLLTINEKHIPNIAIVFEKFGVCYVHGDGQLYANRQKSDHHFEFSDPDTRGAMYRIVIQKKSDIPFTVDEIHKKLFEAKQLQLAEEQKPKETLDFDFIIIPSDDEKKEEK
jgi:hypothetical protein